MIFQFTFNLSFSFDYYLKRLKYLCFPLIHIIFLSLSQQSRQKHLADQIVTDGGTSGGPVSRSRPTAVPTTTSRANCNRHFPFLSYSLVEYSYLLCWLTICILMEYSLLFLSLSFSYSLQNTLCIMLAYHMYSVGLLVLVCGLLVVLWWIISFLESIFFIFYLCYL